MDNAEKLKQDHQQQQIMDKVTDTITLSGTKTHKLSFSAPESMFELKDTRTKEQVREAQNKSADELKKIKSDTKVSYAQRRQTQMTDFKNMSSRLSLDKKWYSSKDSDEMVRVKKTVNYLNNLLDSGIGAYIKTEGKEGAYLDGAALKETVHRAFEEAIDACQNYIDTKARKKEGKWGTGIRRLNKVRQLKTLFEVERTSFDFTVEAIQSKSMQDMDLKTVKEDESYTLRRLSAMHKTKVALDTEWQNQGNSTDVYKIKVMEEGKEVTYYIKENLPLISADIEGFLERRIAQLESSRAALAENRTKDVELRMQEAGMQDGDYDACIKFLKAMQDKIKGASEGDKAAVKKRMIQFFSHDFDRMFTEHNIHNQAAKILDEEGGGGAFDSKKWEDIAKDEKHPKWEVANYILGYMKENAGGEQAGEKKEPLKEISAKDWVIKQLGLKSGGNGDLLDEISKVYGKGNATKLENMLRISLGKEVELFGQMRDRMSGDEKEIAATNNTATGRLAALTGFTDVVTTSDSRIVQFRDRTGKMVERFCTVIESAEGMEYIDVLKEAEKNKDLRIEYSPEAMRQLVRLQAFDTICLQVDRHGRNFKCEVDRSQKNKLVIKSIKSYDHDMSFSEELLKDAFKDGSKKGFLANPSIRIKKDSPMYKYVMFEYFKTKGPDFLYDIKDQDWKKMIDNAKKNSRFQSAVEKMMGDLNKVLVQPFYDKGSNSIAMHFDLFGNKVGDQESAYRGKIKKIGDIDMSIDEAQDELGHIYNELRKTAVIYDRGEKEGKGKKTKRLEKSMKKKFTKEEKAKMMNLIRRLYVLDKNFDFSGVIHDKTNVAGYVDMWMKKILYTYAEVFKQDTDITNLETLMYSSGNHDETELAKRKNAFETLKDKETGDLVIPSLLHFDREAYDSIKEMEESLKAGDGKIEGDLKGLNFRDKKIEALKNRCIEMRTEIETAMKKAQAFFLLAGWTRKDDVRGKFFLEKDDYKKIRNLSEMSVDPGSTYLSIDNENYIYGVKEFLKYAGNADKLRAYETEKKKRRDPKRWKQQDFGKDQQGNEITQEQAIEKLENNPLGGSINAA